MVAMVKSGSSEQVGARRVAERRGGPPWWAVLLALIVLLLLAGAAWLLFFDDDSDVEIVDEATTPTTATPPSTSPPTTDANAAVGAGEIFAGGQRVLPGGESQLTRFVDQPARGRTVRVLSVPSDESFWVGTGTANRVFVHLALTPGESPFNVQPGEMVTFSGTVKALPPDAETRFGITVAEGLNDLRRQGAYIEATTVSNG